MISLRSLIVATLESDGARAHAIIVEHIVSEDLENEILRSQNETLLKMASTQRWIVALLPLILMIIVQVTSEEPYKYEKPLETLRRRLGGELGWSFVEFLPN